MLSVLIFLLSASAILADKIDDGLVENYPGARRTPPYIGLAEEKRHHIPLETESDLDLSPGQIKLFAGHALNLVHAKCPNVDKDAIFQIQKYIGKYIASRLEMMTTAEINPKSKKTEFDNLIKSLMTCSKESRPKPDGNRVMKVFFAPVPMAAVRNIQDTDEPKVANAPNRVFLGFQSETPKETPKKEETKKEGSTFARWMHAIYERIRNLFSGMFTGIGRRRRASGTTPIPKHLTAEQLKGREAIMDVIDQVCRIFCAECGDKGQILTFRMAVKEFMQLAFQDENLLLTAAHGISDSFIKSLKSCDAPSSFDETDKK